MNLKTIIGTFVVGMLLVSCAHSDNRLTVNVSQEVVTSGYIGNGVEWDPYDEAESWGASVSDEDWQKLFKRLDFMRMGYVRCMINSPFRYYDPQTGKYDKTRNIASLSRLLQYCTDHNIVVMYGEYNPHNLISSVLPESPLLCIASSNIQAAIPEYPPFITSIQSNGISRP